MGGLSHCMGIARQLSSMPESEWDELVANLPDGCEKVDCTGQRSCRQRVAEYIEMQRRIRGMIGAPKAPDAQQDDRQRRRK